MSDEDGPGEALSNLKEIAETLLGPDGCPWDRSREPEDFKTSLVEETYEVIEAIDEEDPEALAEELGDLLYQVVFLGELYEESQGVDLKTIIQTVSEKLVRRHPHVFGDASAESPEEGVSQWEKQKRKERSEEEEASEESVALSGVPDHLPALLRSYRLTQKAASAGFDWHLTDPAFDKVQEELEEVQREVERENEERVQSELGDLLFACAGLARKLGHDPENALQEGNDKFQSRFREMEQQAREDGQHLEDLDEDTLLELWNRTGTES